MNVENSKDSEINYLLNDQELKNVNYQIDQIEEESKEMDKLNVSNKLEASFH